MLFPCLAQAAPQPGGFVQFAPFIFIFVLAWFLLIRPVQKQRREQDDMRSKLKPGDAVLTTGGIYGTVTKVRENRINLRIADGVQVELAKSAIASLVDQGE